MALDYSNPFVRDSIEAMERFALEQLSADDYRHWRRSILSAETLQDCSEITRRMLGHPLNHSQCRVAHEVLCIGEMEASWTMACRPEPEQIDDPDHFSANESCVGIGVKNMNRITKEVVLGIQAPKDESVEAAAFRKGVKKEIQQTAKLAKTMGIPYMVELLSDW